MYNYSVVQYLPLCVARMNKQPEIVRFPGHALFSFKRARPSVYRVDVWRRLASGAAVVGPRNAEYGRV